MRDHPVLFSTEMVQAILEGRKTQTRRVVNTNKKGWDAQQFNLVSTKTLTSQFVINSIAKDKMHKELIGFHAFFDDNGSHLGTKCPYGQPGDLLWVRETFSIFRDAFLFKADEPHIFKGIKYKPSIYMPKVFSRIWLQNFEVKVERVADISEEDAIAEGCTYSEILEGYECFTCNMGGHLGSWELCEDGAFPTARQSFKSLWQSINGKPKPIQHLENGKLVTTGYIVYPFDEESAKPFAGRTIWRNKPLTVVVNPWVWVIKFKELSRTGKPEFCTCEMKPETSKP